MASEYHEPREQLSTESLDVKRAIDSIMEELEAVDWYRQRMQAARDPALRAILDHHQREEIEHFAMLLEWLRRKDADFARQLRTYLFTEGGILEIEEEVEARELGAGGGEDAPEARTATVPAESTLDEPPRAEAVEGEAVEAEARGGPGRRESRRRTIGELREER